MFYKYNSYFNDFAKVSIFTDFFHPEDSLNLVFSTTSS